MDNIKRLKRLPWIDSIRGIAALLVVILHFWLLIKNDNYPLIKKHSDLCTNKTFYSFIAIEILVVLNAIKNININKMYKENDA